MRLVFRQLLLVTIVVGALAAGRSGADGRVYTDATNAPPPSAYGPTTPSAPAAPPPVAR